MFSSNVWYQVKYLLTCISNVLHFNFKKFRSSSFYEEKRNKPCSTKQLLKIFKLWYEWGKIILIFVYYLSYLCEVNIDLSLKDCVCSSSV